MQQGHEVEVEDGGLLGFAAFKDLQVSLEKGAEVGVPLNMEDLWVVLKRATRDTDIGHVYDVGLEDNDEDSVDVDLDQAGEVGSSSSSNLRTPMAPSPGLLLNLGPFERSMTCPRERGEEWDDGTFQGSLSRVAPELVNISRARHQRLNIRVVERCVTSFDKKSCFCSS